MPSKSSWGSSWGTSRRILRCGILNSSLMLEAGGGQTFPILKPPCCRTLLKKTEAYMALTNGNYFTRSDHRHKTWRRKELRNCFIPTKWNISNPSGWPYDGNIGTPHPQAHQTATWVRQSFCFQRILPQEKIPCFCILLSNHHPFSLA